MKLYLVRSEFDDGLETIHNRYGIFSSVDKAAKIIEDLKMTDVEFNEEATEYFIDEFELDVPSEDYEFMMNC